MTVHPVETLDLPELAPYRTLRRPLEHYQQGIFIAEGEKVVRRLLDSGLVVVTMLMTPEWFEHFRPLAETRPLTVYLASRALCETIVGYSLHQGIMAIARIPAPTALERLLAPEREDLLLVALDDLEHAENVGVVARNCAAFGADGILVGETSSSPWLRRAVRNSMGAVFRMPVVPVDDLAACIAGPLRAHGVVTIAAHPHETRPLHDWQMPRRMCVVLGNEGLGVSAKILRACDERVSIPMANDIDSLNVASASAVFLAEIVRRRRMS